eukprot:4099294-Pleurochrysis_carterae.AAC.1
MPRHQPHPQSRAATRPDTLRSAVAGTPPPCRLPPSPLFLVPRPCALALSIALFVRRRLDEYRPLILDVSTRRA